MKRILSGMQPSGKLHLGNYFGALKNWVKLQEEQCEFNLYGIVDLHAITQPYDAAGLKAATQEIAAAYIAGGIDVSKSILFVQSAVPEHSQLNWLLTTMTQVGKLDRMTQFKDKAGKNKEKAGLGLYAYPVLMAADILVYKATHVPVGDDQKQHLELSRDIAQKFNLDYECPDFFKIPEPLIQKNFARIMSLKDGTKKMSKSDPSDLSRINLKDTKDEIINKIKKAKTDNDSMPSDENNLNKRPEIENLLSIYSSLSNQNLKNTIDQFSGKNFSEFKNDLAEIVVEKISPISDEIKRLEKDPQFIDNILLNGSKKAEKMAKSKVDKLKKSVIIDFSGTTAQLSSNYNAPEPVTKAAILYCFRLLAGGEIPMNEGVMRPIEIKLDKRLMLSPEFPAAVIAGNVETSQAVTSCLLLALGIQAASQSTMNNTTWGNDKYQYYETICGGTGAGFNFNGDPYEGTSAIHSHMTNSRLTDPEVLENRFPVILEEFSIRQGSGGIGKFNGGEGVIRKVRFLEEMTLAILAGHRIETTPGLNGGGNGSVGFSKIIRKCGKVEILRSADKALMGIGDIFWLETPGGGALGKSK